VTAAAPTEAATRAVIGCPDCGTHQELPPLASGDVLSCITCSSPLERRFGQSLPVALCCSAATLLLLLPANFATFLTTEAFGVSRHSYLASTAGSILEGGWPWLALVIFLFVVVFPLVRFGLLTLVLGDLYLGRRRQWHGRAFRWANELETWAMIDVFLLALVVAYVRLEAAIAVHLGIGAMALIAAAVLSLFTRATLDKATVWQLISPDRAPPDPEATVACIRCELLVPPHKSGGTPCPRCGAALHRREVASIGMTLALTIAAVLLYIPANIYPMAILPIHYRPTSYTVLRGVIDLADAKFYGLAVLVFIASFVIPVMKLVGLGWCAVSVMTRSRRHLVAKTRVYRLVDEVGRWSMVDPFVIGCIAPVLNYNALIHGGAGPAALPFTAVVVLTVFSAKTFDPRLMWDAARRRS
jgi:paraquat-inducible protein A